MINVLQIASGDLWAGAENMVFNLCSGLHKQDNVRVHAVILNNGELSERLRNENIPVTVIDESKHSILEIIKKTKEVVLALDIDVIHTHRQKENVIGAAVKLLTNTSLSIRTVHGASEFCFRPWKLGMLINGMLNWLSGFFVQEVIVSVSKPLQKKLNKVYGKQKVITIFNGVDVKKLTSLNVDSDYMSENTINIGMVGRLVPVKRFDLFVKVAKLCATTNANLRFYILGDGPLYSEIESYIKTHKLSSAVIMLGHVNNAPKIISNLDMVLMMSDHEGLPMTILESMALKVPIVSHAVGEIPTLLGGGKYGDLVYNQNPTSYCDAIHQFISKPDKYKFKAQGAFELCKENYSSSVMVNQYSELYAKQIS